MVAVVAGTGLGVLDSTANQARGAGVLGTGRLGQSGGTATVNLSSGNLILQFLDETLSGQGTDLRQLRTYNAQGETGAGERWRLLGEKRIDVVNGDVVRTTGDGHESTYVLDGSIYRTSAGGGADDTLEQDGDLWIWTDGSTGSVEVYGSDGWIRSARDTSGNGFIYEFSGDDLTRVINFSGGEYDSNWTLINETRGQTLIMGYDQAGRLDTLSTSASPNGTALRQVYYQYDTDGRLQHVITDLSLDDNIEDGDTYTTTYSYDGNSLRIAGISQSDGTSVSYEYDLIDGAYKVTSVTDQGGTTTFDYLAGQTLVTNGAGQTSRYTYDSNDKDRLTLIETLDSSGSVVQSLRYAYYQDGKDNVHTVTDHANNVITYEYDANSNITREEDALGNVVARTWTDANRLATETRYATNDAGVLSNPQTSRFIYDAAGRLRFSLSPDGNVGETRYNSAGQVAASITYTQDRYNTSGLAQDATPTESQLQTWVSQQNRSQTQRTDFIYDQIGNLQRQTTYGQVDANGEGILNASASRTEYVYNGYGQWLQTIENASVAEALVAVDFNETPPATHGGSQDGTGTVEVSNGGANLHIQGNRWQHVPLNYTVTANTILEFDIKVNSAGEIIAVGFDNDSGSSPNRSFQLTGPQTWSGAIDDYSYSGDGAWEHVVIRAGDYFSGNFSRLTFVGDADSGATDFIIGNIRIYEAGEGVVSSRAYDGMGRQISSVSASGTTTTTYGSGQISVRNGQTGLTSISAYDSAGRLQSVSLSGDSESRVTRYYYDEAGRQTAVQNAEGEVSYTFYDDQGRVAYAVNPTSDAVYTPAGEVTVNTRLGQVTAYSYNNLGQVQEERQYADAINIAGWLSGGAVTVATDDIAVTARALDDRITRYTYDDNGRLETTTEEFGNQDRISTNYYDGAGRLVKTSVGDLHTRYYYDADGRQVGVLNAENYLVETRYDAAGRVTASVRYGTEVTLGEAALDTASLSELIANLGTLYHTDSGNERSGMGDGSTFRAQNVLTTQYFYDAQGRQVAALNEQGFLSETEYNVSARETVTRTWMLSVPQSERGSLTEAKAWLADENSEVYTSTTRFDGYGRVSSTIGNDETVSRNIYDSAGRLVRTITAEGTEDETAGRTQYNAFGEVTGVVAGEGEAQVDTVGLQVAIDSYGKRFEYDGLGRKVAELGPQGQKTLYFYNNAGQLTHIVNALGEVSVTTYNSFGQVHEIRLLTNRIDISGLHGGDETQLLLNEVQAARNNNSDSSTTTIYNRLGLQQSVTQSIGLSDTITSTYDYNRYGQVTDSWSPTRDGQIVRTRYGYDNLGRVTDTWVDDNYQNHPTYLSYSNGLVLDSHTFYDGFGRVSKSIGPSGHGSQTTYVDGGRRITTHHTSDLNGPSSTTSYDAMGRELAVTDRHGNTTTYIYNDSARSVEIISPEGVSLTTWKTRTGQTLSVRDGEGNTTDYTYDRNGNLKTVTDALNNVNESFYDNSGRLFEQEDANGNIVRFGYDAANRVISKIIDPDSGLHLETRYQFDGQGRKLYVHEAVGTDEERSTEYRYDRAGRLTQEIVDARIVGNTIVSEKTDALQLSTKYYYDDAGNQTRVERGTVANPAQQVSKYEYDNVGRVTEEILDPDELNIVTEYYYDDAGNLTRTINLNATDAGNKSTWHAYNDLNQKTHTIDALGNVVAYQYNDNGQLIHTRQHATPVSVGGFGNEIVDAVSTVSNTNDRQTWNIYNSDGQETFTVTATDANTWVVTENRYDGNGNVIETRRYDRALSNHTETEAATIAALRALGYRDIAWGDDNTTMFETRRAWYAFDAANRLRYTINAEGSIVENVYDSVGNVTHSVRYDSLLTGGHINHLLSDGAAAVTSRINSLKADTPAITANSRITEYQYDKANRLVGELSPTVNVTSSNGQTQYDNVRLKTRTDYDALGQVVMRTEGIIVNANNNENTSQSRITEYEYDAVGRQTKTLLAGLYSQSAGRVYREGDSNIPGDAYRRTVEVTYDNLGNAVRNRVQVGEGTFVDQYKVYDVLGREMFDIDAEGHVTGRVYNNLGQEETVTRYSSQITSQPARGYWVAGDGAITQLDNDSDRRTITNIYDIAGRKVRTLMPGVGGHYIAPSGTTTNRQTITKAATSLVPQTEFQYNAFGEVIRTGVLVKGTSANPTYANTYTQYDSIGRVLRTMDAQRYVTANQYDSLGNLSRVTEYAVPGTVAVASNGQVTISPGSNPNPDTSGWDRAQRMEYDGMGRVVRVYQEDALYAVQSGSGYSDAQRRDLLASQTSYNAFGETDTTTDALGNVTDFQYNKLGQATQVTLPQREVGGAETSSHLDPFLNSVNASPILVTTYDLFGNVVEQETRTSNSGARGNTITLRSEYDHAGNTIRSYDGENNLTEIKVDSNGRVVEERLEVNVNGSGVTLDYQHDIVRRYSYDNVGRQIRTTEEYTDASGRLQETGSEQLFNAFGEVRFESRVWTSGSNRAWNEAIAAEYRYDDAGRMTWKHGGDGYTHYYYDLAGNVTRTEQRQSNTNTSTQRVSEMVYDLKGQVIEQRQPGFTDEDDDFVIPRIRQAYDRWGNVTSVTDASGNTTYYTYSHQNQVLTETAPEELAYTEGLTARQTTVVHSMDYDAAGRAVVDRYEAFADYTGNAGQTPYAEKQSLTFYDNAGNVTRSVDATQRAKEYSYDIHGNRIASKDGIGHVTVMDYNNNGQVTEQKLLRNRSVTQNTTVDQYGNTHTTSTTTYRAYNDTNSYTANHALTLNEFAYDQAGRKYKQTSMGGLNEYYEYDARGNMVQKRDVAGNLTRYGYDELGFKSSESRLVPVLQEETFVYGYTDAVTGQFTHNTTASETVSYIEESTEIVSEAPQYGSYQTIYGQEEQEYISDYIITSTSQRGSTQIWDTREVEYVYGWIQTETAQRDSVAVWDSYTEQYQSGTTIVSEQPQYGSYTPVYSTRPEEYIDGYTTTSTSQRGSTEIWATRDEEYIYGYVNTSTSQRGSQAIYATRNEQYVSGYQTVSQQPSYGSYEVVYSTRTEEYISGYHTTSTSQRGSTPIYENRQVEYIYGYNVTSTSQRGSTPIYATRQERYISGYSTDSYGNQTPIYSWRSVQYISGYNTPIYRTRTESVLTGYRTPIYSTRQVEYISGYRVPIYSTRQVEYISHYKTPIYRTREVDYFTGEYRTPIYKTRQVQYVSGYEVPVFSTREVDFIDYYDTPVYRIREEDFFTGTYNTPVYDTHMVDVVVGYEVPVYETVYETRTYDNTPIYRSHWDYVNQWVGNTWTYSKEGYETGQLVERTYLNNWDYIQNVEDARIRLSYEYDGFGQLESEEVTTTGSRIDYTYHENGLLARQVDQGPNGSQARVLTSDFEYDEQGRRVRETHATVDQVRQYNDRPDGFYYWTSEARGRWEGDSNNYQMVPRDATVETTYEYDKLNRLKEVTTPQSEFQLTNGNVQQATKVESLRYNYDEWGNRREVAATYRKPNSSSAQGKTELYAYDAEGRVLVADGRSVDGRIVANEISGTAYYYDDAGRMRQEISHAGPVELSNGEYGEQFAVRNYNYTDLGQVETVTRQYRQTPNGGDHTGFTASSGGSEIERYTYNGYGYRTYAKVNSNQTTTTYRTDGQITSQTVKDANNKTLSITNDYSYTDTGQLESYTYRHYDNGQEKTWYDYNYRYVETYSGSQVASISVDSNQRYSDTGTTTNNYDHRGRLLSSQINDTNNAGDQSGSSWKYFAYNAENKIIASTYKQFGQSGTDLQTYFYYNNNPLADIGDNGINIAPMELQRAGGATPGTYTVNAGDTLSGVAQMIFGDASLWYVLAEANALTKGPLDKFSSSEAGQKLRIPNTNLTAQNTTSTFQPYNATEIIGDMTPSVELLPPPEKSCNTFAIILMVVVAVVVTIFTAGAAAMAMAGTLQGAGMGAIMSAGGTLLMGGAVAGAAVTVGVGTGVGGTLMAAGAAFAGGFVGSVASQGVGVATGQVDSISLRSAFSSGLTTVATMGLSYLGGAAGYTDKAAALRGPEYVKNFGHMKNVYGGAKALGNVLNAGGGIGRAMVGAASSYAANKIAGLETNFSWKGLAAQTAGSYVGNNVGEYLGQNGLGWNPYVAGTVAGTVGGSVAGKLNKQWNGGGPVDYARIALDAFANQLGSASVEGMSSQNEIEENTETELKDAIDANNVFRKERGLEPATEQEIRGAITDKATADKVIQLMEDSMGLQYNQKGKIEFLASLKKHLEATTISQEARAIEYHNITKAIESGDINAFIDLGYVDDFNWDERVHTYDRSIVSLTDRKGAKILSFEHFAARDTEFYGEVKNSVEFAIANAQDLVEGPISPDHIKQIKHEVYDSYLKSEMFSKLGRDSGLSSAELKEANKYRYEGRKYFSKVNKNVTKALNGFDEYSSKYIDGIVNVSLMLGSLESFDQSNVMPKSFTASLAEMRSAITEGYLFARPYRDPRDSTNWPVGAKQNGTAGGSLIETYTDSLSGNTKEVTFDLFHELLHSTTVNNDIHWLTRSATSPTANYSSDPKQFFDGYFSSMYPILSKGKMTGTPPSVAPTTNNVKPAPAGAVYNLNLHEGNILNWYPKVIYDSIKWE